MWQACQRTWCSDCCGGCTKTGATRGQRRSARGQTAGASRARPPSCGHHGACPRRRCLSTSSSSSPMTTRAWCEAHSRRPRGRPQLSKIFFTRKRGYSSIYGIRYTKYSGDRYTKVPVVKDLSICHFETFWQHTRERRERGERGERASWGESLGEREAKKTKFKILKSCEDRGHRRSDKNLN